MVRQGGLGSLVSFLIMMINVEQVLTVCQAPVSPGGAPPGRACTVLLFCTRCELAFCVVPVRHGADRPQNYQVWQRIEDRVRIIYAERGVSFHPAPSLECFCFVWKQWVLCFVVSCFLCTFCRLYPGPSACTVRSWRAVFLVAF